MKTDNIVKLFKLKMQLKEEKAVIGRKIRVVDNLVGTLQFMDMEEAKRNGNMLARRDGS
jgi:hypothetical protein